MTIYIEVFLLQNILINFCLLKLVHSSTKYHATFINLILSSLIGSAFSVGAAIIITNNLLLNIIKFICAVTMLKIAFKTTGKQFILCLILLFTYTYALGGAIINLSSSSYVTSFGIITNSKINLTLICAIIICLTYLIDIALKHQKNRLKTNNYIYEVELELNKNKIKINAYLDSGNLLQVNQKPVIILDLNTFLQLSKINLLDFYLNTNNTIATNTVSGCQHLKLFKIDKITIFNKQKIEIENQLIAINTNNAFKNTNYQALISPLML